MSEEASRIAASNDADDPAEVTLVIPESAALEAGRALERERARDWGLVLNKTLHFVAALFLFILAIQLMKTGAKELNAGIRGKFPFANGVSTLGFGWLSAYIVLSGSPVAAVALNLFHGGTVNKLQTFTMLSGSRLGASFIVLMVGFLYAVRNKGRNRGESIGMGVLALGLTAIVYLPGMMIGYAMVKYGALSSIHWQASNTVLSVIDYVWGPAERFGRNLVPGYVASADKHPELWVMLPVGLIVILLSFKLLDRVLPELDGARHTSSRTHWLRKPWPMFLLGCLAATLTLSVSVALTALVPLASKGHITRREAIPYIMGANITTLADTLVAAMVLGNPVGVQIVLAQGIGVAIVTLFYLAFLYRFVSESVLRLDEWVVRTNRRLWLFVAGLFVLPVFFLLSGLVIGTPGT